MSTVRWIIALLIMLLGLVATSVSWKTSTDDHLQRMEEHMRTEDMIQDQENRKLDWLIRHNKDGDSAPMNWSSPETSGALVPYIAEEPKSEASIPAIQ